MILNYADSAKRHKYCQTANQITPVIKTKVVPRLKSGQNLFFKMAENFGGFSVQTVKPFQEICNFGGKSKNCVFRGEKVLALRCLR